MRTNEPTVRSSHPVKVISVFYRELPPGTVGNTNYITSAKVNTKAAMKYWNGQHLLRTPRPVRKPD